jgi:1,4-alpha-glucan branching enzyme
MPTNVTIHYDNTGAFADPHLWVWYDGSDVSDDFAATSQDDSGPVFTVQVRRPEFRFMFKDGPGGSAAVWEDDALRRRYRTTPVLREIWCQAGKAFVYEVPPRRPEPRSAAELLAAITPAEGCHLPDTDGPSGLGATVLPGGGTLFGLYQPNAARVYVAGTFNDWQQPGHSTPDPDRFHELALHRGYFGIPNLWLGVVPDAAPGQEYQYFVQGGVPRDGSGRSDRWCTDPFARLLGPDFGINNAVIVDSTAYSWNDQAFQTPDRAGLILYELSVYGFTEGDDDIERPGTFAGVTQRIREGYFDDLGVTALSLMPLAEFSGIQGPTALGYSTSVFSAVERDFGSPDDLRALVDAAHVRNVTVLLDQVFNHTSNGVNPLWQAILESPQEEGSSDGGLYFSGSTPWGNRVATEKRDVQNLLIDTCKMFLVEYHVDGFRFDATHSWYMDHGFLLRLADELTRFRPGVVLVAENLPNQADLNRSGYDGFSQWADPFHDKMKAMLREGVFADSHSFSTDRLGDVFYFSRSAYAAHTNNAVNYVESHDETSVAYEVGTNPATSHPATKDRKGRLGLFASIVALGLPMIYMGQEFNVERDRNIVSFTWPPNGPDSNGFYRWTSRLIRLRRRYPALRIAGDDPAQDGRFTWILGPWLDQAHGGERKVLGWRLRPNGFAHETMVVLLNFEPFSVGVDLELGLAGNWVKLADLDTVDDIPPHGTNAATAPTALRSDDGRYSGFELPSCSGFLYKWESGA